MYLAPFCWVSGLDCMTCDFINITNTADHLVGYHRNGESSSTILKSTLSLKGYVIFYSQH